MRRAQLLLSAQRRHTLPAPHLFGNQPVPLRPCISVSFSSRHHATLLCDDQLPQDAVHVALISLSLDRSAMSRLSTEEVMYRRSLSEIVCSLAGTSATSS